jgi:hypothetical protein
MVGHLTLIVQTARHRYAVRRDDVLDIKLVNDAADLQADDARSRAYVGIELGPLLDPSDQTSLTRRRALVVPLEHQLVALLADRVESFYEHAHIEALPALLAAQLRQPWAIGAFMLDSDLIIQLDLRAVAHTALAEQMNEH